MIHNALHRQPFQPFEVVMVSGERFLVKDREALSIVSTEGRNRRLFAPYANFITVEGDSIFTRLLDVPLIAQIVGRIDLSHNGH